MKAAEILEAVDRAYGGAYMMIRETGIVCNGGRMDALLVPWSPAAHSMVKLTDRWFWERPRLIGVEVKVTRADFLKGLKSGQYERYDSLVSGLYLAVPRPDHPVRKFREKERVCRLSEVPEGVGLLTVSQLYPHRCRCARNPKLSDVKFPPDVPWRLLFEARRQFVHFRRREWRHDIETNERIGHALSKAVATLRREIRKGMESSE